MCAQNTQKQKPLQCNWVGRTERQNRNILFAFFFCFRRRNLLLETVWFARHRSVFELQILLGSETDSANAFWPHLLPCTESGVFIIFITHSHRNDCVFAIIFITHFFLPPLSSSKSFNIEMRFACANVTLFSEVFILLFAFFVGFLAALYFLSVWATRFAAILHCIRILNKATKRKRWRHRNCPDAIRNRFESISQLATMTTRPIMCASHFSLLLQLKTHDESEWDGMPTALKVCLCEFAVHAKRNTQISKCAPMKKNSVQLRCRFFFLLLLLLLLLFMVISVFRIWMQISRFNLQVNETDEIETFLPNE